MILVVLLFVFVHLFLVACSTIIHLFTYWTKRQGKVSTGFLIFVSFVPFIPLIWIFLALSPKGKVKSSLNVLNQPYRCVCGAAGRLYQIKAHRNAMLKCSNCQSVGFMKPIDNVEQSSKSFGPKIGFIHALKRVQKEYQLECLGEQLVLFQYRIKEIDAYEHKQHIELKKIYGHIERILEEQSKILIKLEG